MLQRPGQMPTEEIWVDLSEFDRLSDLPDELLLHIMCFLTARQAVNTCILSKRWKNLWRYLPCLDFDSREFRNPGNFIQFTTSFFNLRRTSHIDTFRLDWDRCDGYRANIGDCSEPIKPLITRVLESRPRVLSIISSSCCHMEFHSVYTCASVEEMQLHYILVPEEEPIALFNLKRLHLTGVRLDGESMNSLISGCPVLEDLVMKQCSFWYPNVTIISHNLKNLFIDECKFRYMVEIHLSVPSLVSLNVTRVMLGRVWLKNMSSLVKAHMDFDYGVCANYLNSSNELLNGLSTATYIELTGPRILKSKLGLSTESPVKDLLLKELPNCLAFANLKSLYLGGWDLCGFFSPISHFVHLSPNLETLTFGREEEMTLLGTDAFIAAASGNAVFLVGSMPVTIPFAQVTDQLTDKGLGSCKTCHDVNYEES